MKVSPIFNSCSESVNCMNFCPKKRRLVVPKRVLRSVVAFIYGVGVQYAVAIDYGIYDSRALAMGGTAVAVADLQNAQFYNPALLALSDGAEEDTRKGRVYLPVIVGQIADGVETTLDVLDEELDDQLDAAVDAFNAAPSSVTAQQVSTVSRDLQTALVDLNGENLDADIFVGFSVSEPSDRSGGAFYLGARVITGGQSQVTQADLDLLEDYIEAMDFVASGGSAGQPHPELLDGDGNLIDPTPNITSSSNIGSAVFTEWGVSASKEFSFWGLPIALGATPKLMRVDIFREDLMYGDADIDYQDDKRTHLTLNADLGLAMELGKYFRVGLAAKDIIPQVFEAGSGLTLETRARARLGVAFVQQYVSFGIDYDLQQSEALGSERLGRQASAGLELRPWSWVSFRAGYRQDMEGLKEDLISAGVGFRTGRFVADLAYATSDDTQGGGLQLGWTF